MRKMDTIIESILDTDLYKFTMQQLYFHQYPNVKGCRYAFLCRNKGVELASLESEVREQIRRMDDLKLTDEEFDYLKSLGIFKDDYLNYLKNFRFDSKLVQVDRFLDDLTISINGSWVETVLYEVPILAIVNELYFSKIVDSFDIGLEGHRWELACNNLGEKMIYLKNYPVKFAEFGTRRRFSRHWQEEVVKSILYHNKDCLIGTSNVNLARKYGIDPVGTMAHEYISGHIGFVDRFKDIRKIDFSKEIDEQPIGLINNLRDVQKFALSKWIEEYGDKLSIALTDTFKTENFFKDFDYDLASKFKGVRQDSGCPFEFGENMIKHYEKLGIDPKTKTIIFSDSLDFRKAYEIYCRFKDRINVPFGIGTNLTNDVGFNPLSIVIKLIKCNFRDVVKISDNEEKATGNRLVVDKILEAYCE